MFAAAGAINAIARAQVVKRVVSAGMLAPRQHQRVHDALGHDRWLGRALQLGIEKGNVKARVVGDQGRIDNPTTEQSLATVGMSQPPIPT